MWLKKKKRLLILGDSYAMIGSSENPKVGPAWTDLLERNGQYQVTNLAEARSSLWFSFKNFLRCQEEHDKIIFVVTEPHRLYLPIRKDLEIIHHSHSSIKDLIQNTKLINDLKKDKIALEKIEAVNLYFKHILDTEERTVYQKLVIKEIREIRPDTVLIPAFSNSIFDHQSDCLVDVSDRETSWSNLSMYDLFIKYEELRNCHMIDENNQMLYEHVLRWLEGEPVVINRKSFKKMEKKDFEKYLRLKT